MQWFSIVYNVITRRAADVFDLPLDALLTLALDGFKMSDHSWLTDKDPEFGIILYYKFFSSHTSYPQMQSCTRSLEVDRFALFSLRHLTPLLFSEEKATENELWLPDTLTPIARFHRKIVQAEALNVSIFDTTGWMIFPLWIYMSFLSISTHLGDALSFYFSLRAERLIEWYIGGLYLR